MRALFLLLLLLVIARVAARQAFTQTPPSPVAQAGISQGPANPAPAVPLAKDKVGETLAAAHQKLEHGKSEEAIAMLEQLASAAGSPKGVQHELGIAYYRTGKLISAEQACARATDEDPTDIESVQMRGLTLYRLGRPAAAIPFLERVRQWTPNANADANYVLGLCYLNSQRFDDARTAFANQFNVAPNSGAAYLLLGNMLMQANLPEAAADAAKK